MFHRNLQEQGWQVGCLGSDCEFECKLCKAKSVGWVQATGVMGPGHAVTISSPNLVELLLTSLHFSSPIYKQSSELNFSI